MHIFYKKNLNLDVFDFLVLVCFYNLQIVNFANLKNY